MVILTQADLKVKEHEIQPYLTSPIMPPECPSTRFQVNDAPGGGPVAADGQHRAAGVCYDDKQRGQRGDATSDRRTSGATGAEDLHAATSALASTLPGGRGTAGGLEENPVCPCPAPLDRFRAIRAALAPETRAALEVGLPEPSPFDGASLEVVDVQNHDVSVTQLKRGKLCPEAALPSCPHSVHIRGSCRHGTIRWIKVPCKRRACEFCGPLRRARIAERVAQGIRLLGFGHGAGWMVGTFAQDVTPVAGGRTVAKFIRWLRGRVQAKIKIRLQYASTWELTKRGRLHVNLVMAPWPFIPQKELEARWKLYGGGIVHIRRVADDHLMATEVAKSNLVEKLATYLAKHEQAIEAKIEVGGRLYRKRSVCYSKGWPGPVTCEKVERKGEVTWVRMNETDSRIGDFEQDRSEGCWRRSGAEFRRDNEGCDCFEGRAPEGALAAKLRRRLVARFGGAPGGHGRGRARPN